MEALMRDCFGGIDEGLLSLSYLRINHVVKGAGARLRHFDSEGGH